MKCKAMIIALMVLFCSFSVSSIFGQDENLMESDELNFQSRYDRKDLNDAYNKGFEDGKVNETYNYTYQGRKTEIAIKEAYEAGKIEGLVEYYYNQGYLTGMKMSAKVPSDYQYADTWGEPVQLVESYKAGLQKGKEKYINQNKSKGKFSDKEFEAILSESVFIGMSESALLESYGSPDKINITETSISIQKQYVYNRPFHRTTYVYVENGFINGLQYY
jgi:hypothetical protein